MIIMEKINNVILYKDNNKVFFKVYYPSSGVFVKKSYFSNQNDEQFTKNKD